MVKCQQCEKRADYGFTEKVACGKHREEGMTDLHTKKCLVEYCNTRPNFGLPADKSASYCKTHADKGMVDLKNKKCLFESCNTRPYFGLPSDKSAIYCKTHAGKGMIDLVSKRCLFESCNTMPAFGLPSDKSASYCKAHAEKRMIDLKNKRCLVESCNTRPSYGLPLDKSASYCKTHAEKGMVDIKSKKCKLCNLTQSKTGYCSPCFYYLNPEHIKTKRHKTRENTFMYQLKEIYPDLVLDKAVDGGCSRKRPDGLIDLYTHSIIIEIDEDQHRGYSCENKRSMQLFTDLGSRPIIFIRLNPDSYISNGKKMKGCFSLSKSSGELIPNEKEISKRFNVLLEIIDECKSVPDKTVTVVELYFND